MYSASELQQLHRAGKAYKLRTGAILPTRTPQEVAAAIRQAQAAHRTGSDDDDPGFRSHLARRAAAHGLQRLVPSAWAAGRAGKSAFTEITSMDVTRVDAVRNPANGYGVLLAKSGAPRNAPARQDREAVARARAYYDALEKAGRYDALAAQAHGPGDRGAYQEMASREREKGAAATRPAAGHRAPDGRAEALSKAFRYDQMAKVVSDQVESDRYSQLAKAERQKAGIA